MSLKIFHICFIITSTLLCAGSAWWGIKNGIGNVFIAATIAGACVLPIYGVWFWKKINARA